MLFSLSIRFISSSASHLCRSQQHPKTLIPPSQPPSPSQSQIDIIPSPNPNPYRSPRTRTPFEQQFETWVEKLKPGFTPADVDEALRAQSDPDLALDIFRWTAQQRGYKHNHVTYLTMIQIAISGKRYRQAETLIEEVIAGACSASVPLFNSMIKFCCGRKFLFNRAFDVYKKMMKSGDTKPSLETYTLLLNSLLRRFNKLNVCYVYLHAVRSLTKQMKASGVIPDTFALNMIIKAYSKCLEVDEAIRVFREMGFLAMKQRFKDAIDVVFDMLGNSMAPDLLTYKTLLEGLCRDGKGNEAFELLEELRKRDSLMNERTYKTLLNGLHFLSCD
ncbi:hypothetical protein F0562_021705 [Nyssa sinensis]|uniref:Pentacotripeptide-repeat region of PRORP domain-containing protein n=1 Tax=Nyssa sinensis TaxID=561372 RepID=A0A5J5BL40_9ASTE|nr:hypothetical protein F0562_021705 [Nyssa sinensis]